MCSDKNVLKVRIYGAEYSIRSPKNVNDIESIAEFVDKKMREVDQSLRVDSSLKVAILAVLNISDELFTERKEREKLQAQLEDKIKKLNQLIDHKISGKSDNNRNNGK